jgi:predicted DNA-binding protein
MGSKDNIKTISSIRMSRELARKVELAARKKGISKAELVRRALEEYVSGVIDEKPKSAEEILKLVEMRTGRKPGLVRKVGEIFRESYELEDL